ncbi:MAG: rhodanese-like domain-containing protein [Alphaproteobacteria bacterium]|nr:rhodanese-like domain-containing protein [Alphaproteobacteria bacterium]
MSALLLTLVLACGADAPEATVTPQSQEAEPTALVKREDVDVDGLAAALEQGAILIDVRTQAEWDGGHVPGARHLPLDELRPDHPALDGVAFETPVYVICASGGRSSRAADSLAGAGRHAINVKGGTNGWVASGRPVQ